MLRPRSAVRSLPNGGIGKERLNRRFLISPYGFHPAPWAGRAPRRVPRRAALPLVSLPLDPRTPSTFFEPGILYTCLGAEARHYTHVTQKLLFFFCPAGVRSYEKHEPRGNRHRRRLGRLFFFVFFLFFFSFHLPLHPRCLLLSLSHRQIAHPLFEQSFITA